MEEASSNKITEDEYSFTTFGCITNKALNPLTSEVIHPLNAARLFHNKL